MSGFDTPGFEAVHESGVQEVSIRINAAKPSPLPVEQLDRVPWCHRGFYLAERPIFTLDPLFHAGCYYVQEASSMFIAHIVQSLQLDQEPLLALDLCAAPGGKSTLLNDYLHPESLLVANELIKARSNILQDNLTRWGNANTVTTNNDPSAFARLPGYFDLMLVDAPCSGSGMFRKDNEVISEWSEASVNLCSQRQQRILADSLSTLKTGGILIYSTCSYSAEENEQIADWLVETQGMTSLEIPIAPEWGITETRSQKHQCTGYRFYPHELRGEGFFVSIFQKNKVQDSFTRPKISPEKSSIKSQILDQWIEQVELFDVLPITDEHLMFPKSLTPDLRILQQVLYLKNAGTRIGKVINGNLVPNHDLALSRHLYTSIPKIELPLAKALDYLRKAVFPLPPEMNAMKDWAIVTYSGISLGWVKVLPGRVNNYYPKTWRIQSL